jgi:hypothetical protein
MQAQQQQQQHVQQPQAVAAAAGGGGGDGDGGEGSEVSSKQQLTLCRQRLRLVVLCRSGCGGGAVEWLAAAGIRAGSNVKVERKCGSEQCGSGCPGGLQFGGLTRLLTAGMSHVSSDVLVSVTDMMQSKSLCACALEASVRQPASRTACWVSRRQALLEGT